MTEEQVVAHALGEESLAKISQAATIRGIADATRDRTWSNPEVGYTHEQLFGAGSEDTVVFRQVLRLSSRYGLLAEAHEMLAQAERLDSIARRSSHANAIRREFFGLLETQLRLEIYAAWLAQMSTVDDELRRRVEAGESAPYERLRVQKEVADIEAAAAIDRADLAARQVHLAELLDLPAEQAAGLRAAGSLMPTGLPDDAALREAIALRADVAAADARIQSAALLERSARGWWVPEPELEAGYKTAGAAGAREHGFVAGVALTLPLVNAARAQQRDAEALRVEAEGEKEFVIHHVTAEVLGLAQRVRVLAGAAEAYERDGVGTATKVVDTARLAYAAGELGILELIDGYRGLVAARLTVLQFAAQARQSELELWHALSFADQQEAR